MKTSGPSLLGRALLAAVLTIGFYLLALAIAGTMLYLVYAMFAYGHTISLKLTLVGLIGAGVILWSIIPRRDRFVAPGPELFKRDHPRLFAMIEEVATAAGQEIPDEVYLVPDVNAAVTNRGGIMGIGSRRVMLVGLGLLAALDADEVRAVIAHEFGHYHAGDTALGPWIYKTKSTIIRTVNSLSGGGILQRPFIWYGKAFLRITQAVSRQQEFAADRLAARLVGAGPMVSGLKRSMTAGEVFPMYWETEVAPVLGRGFRPGIADGFNRFMGAKPVTDFTGDVLTTLMERADTNPYDSHPSLAERIAALEKLPETAHGTTDSSPGLELLGRVDDMERELLGAVVGESATRTMKALAWTDVSDKVWIDIWREQAMAGRTLLEDVTPPELPGLLLEGPALADRLVSPERWRDLEPEQRLASVIQVVGTAFIVALHADGWHVNAYPGSTVVCEHNGVRIEPFEAVKALASGGMSEEAWHAECAAAGIEGLRIGRTLIASAPEGGGHPTLIL